MKTRWQDWAMLVFGVWLLLSPLWMPGYASASSVAAWNAYVFGVLIVAFTIAAIGSVQRWEEWLELAMGIWLVVAPFVFAFYDPERGAAWNQIVVGLLVAIDAIWTLAAVSRLQARV